MCFKRRMTHVAFAFIREEPTLWQLGTAAGAAAALAMANRSAALQDVDVAALQAEIQAQGGFVHWPPKLHC